MNTSLNGVWFLLLLMLPLSGTVAHQQKPAALAAVYDVRSFGAVGDGIRLNTKAFQYAIDSCSKMGGGTILVPSGTYRIGTIILRSNITFRLEAQATLLGSDRLADYRPLKLKKEKESQIAGALGNQDFGSLHLLYAEASSRITLTGQGTIDGNGRSFWDDLYQPKDRPHQMIQFEGCEDIRIEGITVTNSPFWALHILSSNRIHIRDITILNDPRGPNTDGIDISSSLNVFISGCHISTGDDAICLKGPYADEPTENIIVSDCMLISDDSAVKFGTRSHNVTRNVIVSRCIIRDSNYGIAMFMKDGGTLENVLVSDVMIETTDPALRKRAVFPLFMDIERRDSTSAPGKIRNITFHGITITSEGHLLFGGMPNGFLEGIILRDIHVRIPKAALLTATSKPRGVRGLGVAEIDFSSVPSSITVAFARDVTLRNVTLEMGDAVDGRERNVLFVRETKGLIVDNVQVRGGQQMLSMISLDQCSHAYIRGVRVPPSASAFLSLSGSATRDVSVIGNDVSATSTFIQFAPEVNRSSVYESQNLLPCTRKR